MLFARYDVPVSISYVTVAQYLIIPNFRPEKVFLSPWGRKAPSWEWSLQTCDGPRYRLTGNDSEKNLAENILRAGPGYWPITLPYNLTYTLQCNKHPHQTCYRMRIIAGKMRFLRVYNCHRTISLTHFCTLWRSLSRTVCNTLDSAAITHHDHACYRMRMSFEWAFWMFHILMRIRMQPFNFAMQLFAFEWELLPFTFPFECQTF